MDRATSPQLWSCTVANNGAAHACRTQLSYLSKSRDWVPAIHFYWHSINWKALTCNSSVRAVLEGSMSASERGWISKIIKSMWILIPKWSTKWYVKTWHVLHRHLQIFCYFVISVFFFCLFLLYMLVRYACARRWNCVRSKCYCCNVAVLIKICK